MKPLFTSFIFCIANFCLFGQITTESLEFNNVNAAISNSGSVFNDAQNGLPRYELPKGGGVHPIFTAQFWFAGLDINGQLHASLGGVENLGTDVDQGPISSTGMYSDPSYNAPFMASICQEEIDNFNLWWECSNGVTTVGCDQVQQPSSTTLNTIYEWPAHGDVSIGQDFYLFPFYDRDGDGVYDPLSSGDYPLIKGCCATYMVQNDAGVLHTYSGADPIGMEMHYMFYQFGANSDLYNTTFVDVMAINKGTISYPEFACSFMVDGDIGVGQDDYFGSDSLTSTMIFYNSDNLDQGGYEDNPPAIGIVALETPSTSVLSYGFFPSPTSGAWNLMNGLQPNGVPLQHPNGTTTKFLANGDPNDPSAWNETSAGYTPGQRKGLNSTNYGAFNPGDTILQTYAIVYAEGGNHLENASNVINLASWAKTFYDTEINDGCDAGGVAGSKEIIKESIEIYPNPSAGKFTISSEDAPLNSVEIYDVAGKQINFEMQDLGFVWRINLEEHTPGVYIVQVETDLGMHLERIIID